MSIRFSQLHPRQQIVAVGGAGLVLVLLVGLACWHVHGLRDEARRRRDESIINLEAMRALAADYRQLQAERGANEAGLAGLSAVVNDSLQGRNFQPSRIQQSGDNQLQLRVEAVAFNDALAWLAMLEEAAGVNLDSVSFSQAAEGQVSVQLALSSH